MPSLAAVNIKRNLQRTATGLHRQVFDLSKGRLAGKAFGMPVVKLTTTGRKSGQPRDTMLTTPVHDESRIVLVASDGGAPHDPAWYLNLRHDPHVTVTLSGRTRTLVARTASDDEKAALWPQIVAAYPGYAGYQTKTDRNIPVVILEPA
jgi:deazaflavin-dependent oxidoreductase (nitroreductase family)